MSLLHAYSYIYIYNRYMYNNMYTGYMYNYNRIKYFISKRDRAYRSGNKCFYKYYRKFYDEKVKLLNMKNPKQWRENVKQICNLNK